MSAFARPGERLDDLCCGGLSVLQRRDGFRFGMDAVLLSAFAARKAALRVADLGTGTGVIPLLLSVRLPKATFDALELQADMADMASRSVLLNGLESRIRIHAGDLRDLPGALPRASYDLVTCNPPYGRAGGTLVNPEESVRVARHEADCTVTDVARAAARLLRNGGRLCVVFPAPRMLELRDALRAERIEPKRLQWVHDRADKPPYLLLCEGMLLARPLLHLMPPLIVHDEAGRETPMLRQLYNSEAARPDA